MDYIVHILLLFANKIGYLGLYVYMFMVGTFVPVPSEIVLIPSGYLASIGEKDYTILLLTASLGSLSGALFNYHFALFVVRKFFKKKRIIGKITRFFKRHGKISVFLAPLTPGLGQYISIPAGLSRMKLKYFIPLTFSANLIWVNFMLLVGYIFGKGEIAHQKMAYVTLGLFSVVVVVATIYVFYNIKNIGKKT